MNRKRKIIRIIALGVLAPIVLLVFVLGMMFFPRRVDYVDTKPAVAIGEAYFSRLEQSQLDEAFELYTEGFLQKKGTDWQQVLTDLDANNGVVKGFDLLSAQVVPVVFRNGTDIPCVLARYRVLRMGFVSEEKLTICPHQRGDEWGIGGHEITRCDTGQHFKAGVTIVENGIALGSESDVCQNRLTR